jgi:nucleotide-binding universal stress UspA family protein
MMPLDRYRFHMAIQDFQAALKRAAIQEAVARVTGKATELLSYDEVAEKLKLRARTERGLQQIPLDAIVGSVGRYTDFTRTFLPRRAGDQDRWARVKAAMEEGAGLPPIEVYKVGQAYFVVDGNHRVSIARQEGFDSIQARVIEFKTDIPLQPDVQPDELIIKAEYADFLDATQIMELRPNVDLELTIPGQYEKLMEQICRRECLLEHGRKGGIPFQAAVEDWYDNTYIPLTEAIRDRHLLHWFPGRTVTDLYVWISENRAALEQELGWEIQSDIAAAGSILEGNAGSASGAWSRARAVARYTESLFKDILIPLNGEPESWDALEQGIVIAKREGARIHGLHIVSKKGAVKGRQAEAVQAHFNQRCAQADIDGSLAVEFGDISRKISERAVVNDLIILKLEHPPQGRFAALKSPFRSIIARSSQPLLTVPGRAAEFQRAILAYDGSLHARQALFVAAYLAEIWKSSLTVFTGRGRGAIAPDVQDHVRKYLEFHEVEAEYVITDGGAVEELNRIAEGRGADLVLMGGYGRSAFRDMIIGSSLDHMLRVSRIPLFICR